MSGIDHKKLSEILGSEYTESETPEKIQLQPSSTFESPFSKPNTSAKSGMGLKDDPSPPDTMQQLRDQCKRHEEVICTLQKTIDKKADVIVFQDNLIAHLTRQVHEQDKRYAEAGSMAAWQQKEVDSLTSRNQNQLKVIDGLRAELAEKARQLDNAWKTCEDRGEELNDMRPEIDSLTKQLDQRTDELTRAQHTVAEALETIDRLTQEVDTLNETARLNREQVVAVLRAVGVEWAKPKGIPNVDYLCDKIRELAANQHKPPQWERRLPTQEECDGCIILEQRNGIELYEPAETNADEWEYCTAQICIIPAILPAVEPPQKVIQRLWVWVGANGDTSVDWFGENEVLFADPWGEWHRTDTTRDKPQ
jgi:myosin heavy subunit